MNLEDQMDDTIKMRDKAIAIPMTRRVDISADEIALQKLAIPEALQEINLMIQEREATRERRRIALGAIGRKRDSTAPDLPSETLDELHDVRDVAKMSLKLLSQYYEKHWRQGKKLGCGCEVCSSARPLLLLNAATVGDVIVRLDAERAASEEIDRIEAETSAQAALTGVQKEV
jgi:hypothetical protein